MQIAPAKGKLGVLLVGLGAVSTTFVAGVEAVKKGIGEPIGSLTQMGTIRLGKRTDNKAPLIKDFISLSKLDDLVFGAWDIFPDNAYDTALHAGVLEKDLLSKVKKGLQALKPMKAVFDQNYVKRFNGTLVKNGKTKMDLAKQLMDDIAKFKRENRCNRLVMIWCASTETFLKTSSEHKNLATFEKAMGANSEAIAPGLKTRMLGLRGWYSTNILGSRDGEVLDDPGSFKTKEESKLSVLEYILQPEVYPKLYGHFDHLVRINYYPPRGDNKEGWDNIDIFGWLGYPMQIKINFLCRDSILAAPIVLDLVLLMDLAARAGMGGIQEWLSFYFKSPMTAPGLYPEHDLMIQQMKLKNTLRHLKGEKLITHLGMEYYE